MNNLNDIFFAPAANQDLTYDQVLEDVQRYFAENHASTIAEAGEANAERATALLKELMVQYIVKRKYAISGLTTEQLCEQLYEDMAGYSFLKKWIYKPGIEEVNINAYNTIIIENKAYIIIVTLCYRLFSDSKGRPCFRRNTRSRAALKRFHGNLATLVNAHPLIE